MSGSDYDKLISICTSYGLDEMQTQQIMNEFKLKQTSRSHFDEMTFSDDKNHEDTVTAPNRFDFQRDFIDVPRDFNEKDSQNQKEEGRDFVEDSLSGQYTGGQFDSLISHHQSIDPRKPQSQRYSPELEEYSFKHNQGQESLNSRKGRKDSNYDSILMENKYLRKELAQIRSNCQKQTQMAMKTIAVKTQLIQQLSAANSAHVMSIKALKECLQLIITESKQCNQRKKENQQCKGENVCQNRIQLKIENKIENKPKKEFKPQNRKQDKMPLTSINNQRVDLSKYKGVVDNIKKRLGAEEGSG